jgi:2-polyprenyl-3-methyl-5-hydroxy-6-metoxy-1,4-benzoquinol methylase
METQYNNLAAEYSSKPEEYYDLSRDEMVAFVPKSSQMILEIGCSSGAFGSLLKKAMPGCKVWGIEPDERAAEIAVTRLDRVIQSTFPARIPVLEGQTFDVICFNDVLEHMANPELALRECHSLLNNNGVVVASLPNILFFYQITKILIEQDWRYEESGILDNTHLRFFTKKSIVRMFESCGYNVLGIAGINASYGMKFSIANMLTLGRLNDWKFVQFAVQAEPIKKQRT